MPREGRTAAELEFLYCVLGATWSAHEGNNGGFIVQYGVKDFGFGEVAFVIEKDGTLTCDSEICGREFVDRVLQELSKRARLRDNIPGQDRLIDEGGKHGKRDEIFEETTPGAIVTPPDQYLKGDGDGGASDSNEQRAEG